jgi:hypothetical protein
MEALLHNQCLFDMFASLIHQINVENVYCICAMPSIIYRSGIWINFNAIY